MSKMKVKVVFGSDMRLWRYPDKNRYQAIASFICKTFDFAKEQDFYLQFEDDEGDRMTLSNESDFEDAFTTAEQENRKSLKVYVIKGSIAQAHAPAPNKSDNGAPNSSPVMEPTLMKSDFNKSQPLDSPSPEPPIDDDMIHAEHPCRELREKFLLFAADPKIEKLLPEVARQFMLELRRVDANKDVSSEEQNELFPNPRSAYEILQQVLNQADFAPITQHEFYVNILSKKLWCLTSMIENYRSTLLSFSDEQVTSYIPNLLGVMRSVEMDLPNVQGMFPTWFAFMKCDRKTRKPDSCDAVHNARCDKCHMSPIKGARFKCCICTDFDLCTDCEASGTHDVNHPMIKLRKPVSADTPHPCIGLWEFKHSLFDAHGFHGHHPHHPHHPHHHGHHPAGPPPPHGHGGMWGQPPHMGGGRGHMWRWGTQQQQQQQGSPPQGMGMNGPMQQGPMMNGPGPYPQQFHRWQQVAQDYNSERASVSGKPADMNSSLSGSSSHSNQSGFSYGGWRRGRHYHGKPKSDMQSQGSSGYHRRPNKLMAEFVCDVNIKDRSFLSMGQTLEKRWRMRNSGKTPWGDGIELVFFKGNETLAFQKRFPVPNAVPDEIVEVTAMIRTPNVPGRYCTYYRLFHDGEYFGPRVWVDIFAVENPDDPDQRAQVQQNGKAQGKEAKAEQKMNKLEAKKDKLMDKVEQVNAKIQNLDKKSAVAPADAVVNPQEMMLQKNEIQCMCGAPLVRSNPSEVYYHGATVHCDICGKRCPPHECVYHCPQDKNPLHPEGYDLCTNCVEMQINFDFQQAQQAQGQAQPFVQGAEALVGKAFKAVQGLWNKKVQPRIGEALNGQNVASNPQAPVSLYPQVSAPVPPVDVEEQHAEGVAPPQVVANAADEKQQQEQVPPQVEKQQGNVVVISEEAEDEFAYPSQLRYIMDMKFQNVDESTVRFLLLKHKGDANQVINQIINQAP